MKRTRRNIRKKLRKSRKHRGGVESQDEQEQLQIYTQFKQAQFKQEEEEKKNANHLYHLNNFYDLYKMYTLSNIKSFYHKFLDFNRFLLLVKYSNDSFGDIDDIELLSINFLFQKFINSNDKTLEEFYTDTINPKIHELRGSRLKNLSRILNNRKYKTEKRLK